MLHACIELRPSFPSLPFSPSPLTAFWASPRSLADIPLSRHEGAEVELSDWNHKVGISQQQAEEGRYRRAKKEVYQPIQEVHTILPHPASARR